MLGSCKKPPKTKEETQNYLIPNERFCAWISDEHTFTFWGNGTFEKETKGLNFVLEGIWEVQSPGKIIIQFEHGKTYHFDVVDEQELIYQPSGHKYTPLAPSIHSPN